MCTFSKAMQQMHMAQHAKKLKHLVEDPDDSHEVFFASARHGPNSNGSGKKGSPHALAAFQEVSACFSRMDVANNPNVISIRTAVVFPVRTISD